MQALFTLFSGAFTQGCQSFSAVFVGSAQKGRFALRVIQKAPEGIGRLKMTSACALAIFSGRIIFIFGLAAFTAIKTKSPGGRVLSGVTLCNYFLLGFLIWNANAI